MTWGPGVPATPTAHTNITVPFYVTNVQEPLLHIRAMLPDAASSNLALISTAGGDDPTATWKQVPTEAIADLAITTAKINANAVTSGKLASGVAVANLGFTPVDRAGGTGAQMTGHLQVRQRLIMEANGGVPGHIRFFDTDGIVFWEATPIAGTGDFAIVRSVSGAGLKMSDGGVLTWFDGRVWTEDDAPSFDGALSALSGAFTNAVTAASATLSGALSAASGTFSGNVGLSGDLTVGGDIGASDIAASGSISAASGTIGGSNIITTTASAFSTRPSFGGIGMPVMAVGTYSGAAGSAVQKTCGFAPSRGRIVGNNGTATVVFDLVSTTANQGVRIAGSGTSLATAPPSTTRLHASNGFVVDGADGSDASGYTYYWQMWG